MSVVRGYPTLKLYEEGRDRVYDGGRNFNDIIGFADRMSGPLLRTWLCVRARQGGALVVFSDYYFFSVSL